jgi:hypothetical protein
MRLPIALTRQLCDLRKGSPRIASRISDLKESLQRGLRLADLGQARTAVEAAQEISIRDDGFAFLVFLAEYFAWHPQQ